MSLCMPIQDIITPDYILLQQAYVGVPGLDNLGSTG